MKAFNVLWDSVPALPEGLDADAIYDLEYMQTPRKIRSRRGRSFGYWRDRKGGYSAMTLIPTVPSIISAVKFEFCHAEGKDDGIEMDDTDYTFWKVCCDDRKYRVIAFPTGVNPNDLAR